MTTQNSVLAACAAFVVLATPVALAAGESKPNVILIMADDLGYECFGCCGSKQYRTPNIDHMAERGMRFNHCYSQPLCTPSRVKLMTGLSNARNYSAFSILNRDQRTIGHHFQAAGYATLVAGKWQLLGAEHYAKRFRGKGTLPQGAGFDHHCLWQVDRLGSRFWNPLLTIDGKTRQFGKDDYGPDIVTQTITDFMADHHQRRKPFFVYYPMILVHSPFLPTPDSKSRKSKNRQRNFEDMVAYMDKCIGRIVGKAEDLGITEDTLILFMGDNGTHKSINSKLGGRIIRGGKGQTTDAGTRVPLVPAGQASFPRGRSVTTWWTSPISCQPCWRPRVRKSQTASTVGAFSLNCKANWAIREIGCIVTTVLGPSAPNRSVSCATSDGSCMVTDDYST